MLKIKDSVDLEELLKIDIRFNLIKNSKFEDGLIALFFKTHEFQDNLDNGYYEYLQIDKATRIITNHLDSPRRELFWETSQIKLDQIPFEIRDLVEKVGD